MFIESNDPILPSVNFGLTASCPAILVVELAQVDFGKVFVGEPANPHRIVKIADAGGKPFVDPERVKFLCDDSFFHVDRRHKDGFVFLDFSFDRNRVEGRRAAFASVAPDEISDMVKIPIQVEFANKFKVVPSLIDFTQRDKSAPVVFFVLRSDGEEVGPVEFAPIPVGLRLAEIPTGSRNKRKFSVQIGEGHSLTRLDATVNLMFKQTSDICQLRVLFQPTITLNGRFE